MIYCKQLVFLQAWDMPVLGKVLEHPTENKNDYKKFILILALYPSPHTFMMLLRRMSSFVRPD